MKEKNNIEARVSYEVKHMEIFKMIRQDCSTMREIDLSTGPFFVHLIKYWLYYTFVDNSLSHQSPDNGYVHDWWSFSTY